ncbi:MAG TPA: carboxypeptidase-like regulatory domain-containing protein [Pirellulaceae bacterium]
MRANLRSFLVFSALTAFCARVTLGDELIQQLQNSMPAESIAGVPDDAAADPAPVLEPEIMLRESGEFAGRVRVIWPTGKIQPANAEVSFLREGEIIGSAHTDEIGHFQLTGLEPGKYVARASIPEGAKDFEIAVVQHVPEALPSQMFMDATLTPMPDAMGGEILADTCGGCGMCEDCLATEVIAPMDECMVEPYQECMMGAPCASSCGSDCCGFSGGGCCGGGGMGLGALAGLAGLAGLAALADDDDTPPPAQSPFVP